MLNSINTLHYTVINHNEVLQKHTLTICKINRQIRGHYFFVIGSCGQKSFFLSSIGPGMARDMTDECDQLPDGLIAQLVEHCTGTAEVMSSSLNFYL